MNLTTPPTVQPQPDDDIDDASLSPFEDSTYTDQCKYYAYYSDKVHTCIIVVDTNMEVVEPRILSITRADKHEDALHDITQSRKNYHIHGSIYTSTSTILRRVISCVSLL